MPGFIIFFFFHKKFTDDMVFRLEIIIVGEKICAGLNAAT